MKDHRSWHNLFLIFALLVCPIRCNSVCEVSLSSLDWKTAGLIIANSIIGEIPDVGPWLEAFADILEQVSNGGYSKDITSCVESLIEQKLDERVLASTETFVVYWDTLLTTWNESSLESNFSNTKLDMVDLVYSTFPGALVDLPNVEKKEQVYTQWFEIVATEVFVFESTAVQYAAHYGNRSNQSCTAWNRAELYSATLITGILNEMINCSINCLNSSTYLRANKIGWNCETIGCDEDNGFLYWVKDMYNGTSDYASRVSHCSQNPCHCEGGGAFGDCICDIFCFHHCDHYNHECDHAMEEYKGKVEVQLKSIQDYVDKMMKLLNDRLAVIRNQIKQWC